MIRKLSSPIVAVPVGLVTPVSSLVLQHETVNGVASIEDGHRGTQLAVPHRVMQRLVAFEHQPIILQNLQPFLQAITNLALRHAIPVCCCM